MQFNIGNKSISSKTKPYFIAEISGNHLQNIDRCIKLIKESAKAGAAAVKLQTIDPSKITLNTDDPRFIVTAGPWKGRRLAEIYEENMLPKEWHEKLFESAKEYSIDCFSSPFDVDSVDFLNRLDVPAFKVASNEIHDYRILEAMAKTKKPLIISTGTTTKDELAKTLCFLEKKSCLNYALLYCVSSYPPKHEEIYLKTMLDMKDTFHCEVGISDHTLTNEVAVAATAMGGSIIEKHVTLSRADGGNDAHFSLEPHELTSLIASINNVWASISGGVAYPGEKDLSKNGIFTRNIWTKRKVEKGDLYSWDNIQSIRSPSDIKSVKSNEIEYLIGNRSTQEIEMNEPVPRSELDLDKLVKEDKKETT